MCGYSGGHTIGTHSAHPMHQLLRLGPQEGHQSTVWEAPLLLPLPSLCTSLGCPFRRWLWCTAFHRCLRLWLLARIIIFRFKRGVLIGFHRCLRLWLLAKINIFRLKRG